MKESKTIYAYLIEHLQNPSFIKIWDIAYDFVRKLPSDLSNKLHEALNRGIDILDSEPLLQMYVYAFGKMHNAKLQFAFNKMHDMLKEKQIQIVDYGCGQGLASICYHDYILEHNYGQKVSKLILIEPSQLSLSRAELLCSCFYPETEIITINKSFDDLAVSDICVSSEIPTLHLFSNILDVESFDLHHLGLIVSGIKSKYNELVIVSPIVNEARTMRLKTFASNFKGCTYYENYFDKRQLIENKDWTCSILLCSDRNAKDDMSCNLKLPILLSKNTSNDEALSFRLLGDYYSAEQNNCKDFTLAISYYTKAGKLKDVKSIISLIQLFQRSDCSNLFGDDQIDVFVIAAKMKIPEISKITSVCDNYIDSNGVRYGCNGLIVSGSSFLKEDAGGELIDVRTVDKKKYNLLNGIRIIGDGAFSKCFNLREMEIPPTVNFIGTEAFHGCYFPNSLKLPNSLVYIGDQALSILSKDPMYIDDTANPPTITIPESVEMINGNPFVQTTIINNKSPHFKVVDNVLYSADGAILISYCSISDQKLLALEHLGIQT